MIYFSTYVKIIIYKTPSRNNTYFPCKTTRIYAGSYMVCALWNRLDFLFRENYHHHDRHKNNINSNEKDFIILAGAGPASKPLAYDLSKEGIQIIDVGHGFEHFYEKDKSKTLNNVLV